MTPIGDLLDGLIIAEREKNKVAVKATLFNNYFMLLYMAIHALLTEYLVQSYRKFCFL